jgi:hypothetical protein
MTSSDLLTDWKGDPDELRGHEELLASTRIGNELFASKDEAFWIGYRLGREREAEASRRDDGHQPSDRTAS